MSDNDASATTGTVAPDPATAALLEMLKEQQRALREQQQLASDQQREAREQQAAEKEALMQLVNQQRDNLQKHCEELSALMLGGGGTPRPKFPSLRCRS